ncbi:hypothetical protein K469DRAFT_719130 [Zopfia rhizophila CBS 207.26]|uniref:Uncharacterized protein n=1 Tax=Zopfia rhizophila CBS 207.26 TaxID=1314779 RepID=A0A6A6EM79_9PEZI|nr:hypothetical protein K469DRAFT_719130 [Zopfia rhizophila CBS 207.26]
MPSIPNPSLCYDSDDAFPRSPGLQPIIAKATPPPSPPPPISQNAECLERRRERRTRPSEDAECLEPRKRRRKLRTRPRRTRPSQGDEVLMNFMDSSRPDIARAVGQSPLNSASECETSESEDERSKTKNKEIFRKESTEFKEGLAPELEEAFGPTKTA